MAEFSKFNGFDVKDKTSREGIRALQEALENLPIDDIDNEIKQLKNKTNDIEASLNEFDNIKIDNTSITLNEAGNIQTVGVLDQNTGNANKYWTGTRAEYEAIVEKDENTFYYITDDIIEYITNSVDNLINYYLKSETYNKEEVNALISNINSFSVLVVDSLPSTNIDAHTIYLIPKENEIDNNYDEYIFINNVWEHIGSTSVDLTEYYKKSETLSNVEIVTLLQQAYYYIDKQIASNVPNHIKNITQDQITKWNSMRNIYVSTTPPSANEGVEGDIWLVCEEE